MTQHDFPDLNDLLSLSPCVSNDQAAALLIRAHNFAEEAHANQRRESGELYIEHDRSVVFIMMELGVDANTAAAALLHDTLHPHSQKTKEALAHEFNPEIVSLVAGIKNLYDFAKEDSYKKHRAGVALENIRRAILSIIEGDIRIILIRMAACLQDLRTAADLPDERRIELATEAMNIYAPLANRLGVWQLKWELEDMFFRYLEPETYHAIAEALSERREERAQKIEQAIAKLRAEIEDIGIEALVTGRPKHIYSIWRKMKRKGTDLAEIYDVQALRIILEPLNPEEYETKTVHQKVQEDRRLCYQVLGLVYSLWRPIPEEFDDYIAMPKPNGYQSLHTAVFDPIAGDTLEVQIRTIRMHEEAEKGVAAHWAYKEGGNAHVSPSVQRRIKSLRDLLSNLQDGDAEGESVEETVKLGDQIYVYTPNGDVRDLPVGSTPIDFAYQIHTEVGHRCQGAKVNGKWTALDYKLKTGDRVEIVTGKRGRPNRDWMNPNLGYTANPSTRAKIRRWFRDQDRELNIEQGRAIVERELKKLGLSGTFSIKDIAKALKRDDIDDFLAQVGFGDFQTKQITGAIIILRRDLEPDDELRPLLEPIQPKAKGITVRGLPGLPTKMAGCCNPIPPESIVGYITRGTGVTIHKASCKQLEAITERERLIEVNWGAEATTFPIPIVIEAYQRDKLVDDIANILRGQGIAAPKTKTNAEGGVIQIYMMVEVVSIDQLTWLLNRFSNLRNVISAQRQRWR